MAKALRSFVRAAPAGADETGKAIAPEAAAAPAEQVAIIVCHGMGQQVPFETIDGVARMLRKEIRRAAAPPLPEDRPTVTTRIVDVEGEKIGRAEISTAGSSGGTADVHIYETYWAPLTAGKATLGDVFGFLKDAGISGIFSSRGPFDRYIFEAWQSFAVRFVATAAKFLGALAVLLSLALMSATIVAVGAARALTRGASGWPSNSLMADLTCDFALFGAFASILGLLYFLAWLRERDRNQRNDAIVDCARTGVLNRIILAMLLLTLFVTIVVGLLVLWHLATDQAAYAWGHWDGWLAQWMMGRGDQRADLALIAIWGLVFYLNNTARKLLVDFMGDVAAYVAAHTASKFYEIRQLIQKRAKTVGRAVYSLARKDGKPFYDRVIVMGHSLGSVVAYDLVNALLLDEETGSGGAAAVRNRTTHLVTFGSPLDKTAFIFREQQPRDSQVRESLAANVQPLILAYANRRDLAWINLWSAHDPISGRLEYYDVADPASAPGAHLVDNHKDLYCNIPVLAHTMYWQSPCLGAVLLAAVQNRDCGAAAKASGCAG